MPNCLAKIIPVQWFRTGALALVAACCMAAQAPDSLTTLVRAYRHAPSPAGLATIKRYATLHPRESGQVDLALGVAAYEQTDYPEAIARLTPLAAKFPKIADYVAYYLAAAHEQAGDAVTAAQLAPVRESAVPSPLAGKAWLVEAESAKTTAPADAVKLLRDHYSALPQPEGALVLADCYQAAGDLKSAADFYQRVYFEYPTGDAAARSAAAIITLRDSLGKAFPEPLAAQMLHRAERLQSQRDFGGARTWFISAEGYATGLEREQALVREAAVDLAAGSPGPAASRLRGLDLKEPEADAERLYWLVECGRKMEDHGMITAAVDALNEKHAQSPWRLRALLGAAAHYFAENDVERYVSLYQAAYRDFPNDASAGTSHWRLAFQAYLSDAADAETLLREHVQRFPAHATAGAGLYFLGRLAERHGDFSAARAYYDRILTVFGNYYYAGLASARLAAPEVHAAAPAEAVTRFLAAIPFPQAKPLPKEPTRSTAERIERSRILRAAGLPDLADAELRFGAATDAQPVFIGLEIAGNAESPHLAAHAMKVMTPDYLTIPLEHAPRQFWEYLFPLPYREALSAAARTHGLDPYLLAGLIRQESEFDPNALSHAGAYGLTQVRPGTGRQFAAREGIARFTTRTLLQPAANLKIGAAIFRSMLNNHDGSLEETLAAYNAGPARAAEWMGWRPYREPAEFVESIPYNETRDYVQAVLRNAAIYRRLYK